LQPNKKNQNKQQNKKSIQNAIKKKTDTHKEKNIIIYR